MRSCGARRRLAAAQQALALALALVLAAPEGGVRRGAAAAAMSCDIYDGNWVAAEPRYRPDSKCILGRFNCMGHRHHKPGSYRWQPRGCALPEFSARGFLSCMRNRRLQFVGDSLSGNWLASLTCLLSGERQEADAATGIKAFPEYNFSMSHARSNHLVRKLTTQVVRKKKAKAEVQILKLDEADPGWVAKSAGATDMVFVTGPHWSPASRFYQEGGKLDPRVHPSVAIGRAAAAAALATAGFPGQRFFMSFPPDHFRNGAWNKGGKCSSFRTPQGDAEYLPAELSVPHNRELENALRGTGVKVLNMTMLMGKRPDAHPADLQSFMVAGGKRGEDCVHWCLPGVPDTWTEVLAYELGCHM